MDFVTLTYRQYARLVAKQAYEGLTCDEQSWMMDLRLVLETYWEATL